MHKTLERSTPHPAPRWAHWLKLVLATLLSLLLTLTVTILWLSYQQTSSYLHPARQTASGAFLQAHGIIVQEVELLTEDSVKLSAWYTPPTAKPGAVILL